MGGAVVARDRLVMGTVAQSVSVSFHYIYSLGSSEVYEGKTS